MRRRWGLEPWALKHRAVRGSSYVTRTAPQPNGRTWGPKQWEPRLRELQIVKRTTSDTPPTRAPRT